RDVLSLLEQLDHQAAPRGLVVLVGGDEPVLDAELSQQHRGAPGIFRENHIHLAQNLGGPVTEISKIADRGGYDVEGWHGQMLRKDPLGGSPAAGDPNTLPEDTTRGSARTPRVDPASTFPLHTAASPPDTWGESNSPT